jgi:cephalosporin hydroxylase
MYPQNPSPPLFRLRMVNLLLKGIRYVRCYGELAFGSRKNTSEWAIDYCTDRPIVMAQIRSEIVALGKLLREVAPRCSMEIGTNYGGTLLLLCTISPPGAQIISLDLPLGKFGGGYPKRKIPLFRLFPRNGQKLSLIRGDSHLSETRQQVQRLLGDQKLDYLFIDGDHTYEGVKRDFEMYAPFVRSGGIVAFHDIARHTRHKDCEVDKFWNELKQQYRHQEFIENPDQGWAGIGVIYLP